MLEHLALAAELQLLEQRALVASVSATSPST
jgi:hypothetical protein